MRKLLCLLVLSLVLMSLLVGGENAIAAQKLELSCGSVDAIGTPGERTVNYMADLIKEKTNGNITIKSFPANQLGNPPDMIEQCAVGALDILWADISNYGPILKDYNVFGMGYTFRDQDHLRKFLESPDYQRMTEELRTTKGILTISSGAHRVPRDVFSKKPIKSADDFVGMKFRVPGLEMYLKTFEGIGTNPVRIAYGEAYMALSQGLVDGIENPLPAGYGMKFHQVAKYIVPTGHIRTVTTFVINEKKFNSLSPEYQEIIREAAKAGDEYFVNLMQTELDAIHKKLEEEGAEFLPPIDVVPLQQKLIPVAQEMEAKGTWSKGLWERIQEIK